MAEVVIYNYPQDFLASLSNEACMHDIHPHVRSPEGPKDCCGRQPRSAQVLHMQGDNAFTVRGQHSAAST